MFKKDVDYSFDLECAVIGACLIERTAFGRIYGIVDEEAFYFNGYKLLFRIIKDMWESNLPVDIITVCLNYTKKHGQLIDDAPASYFICKTTNMIVSTANLEYHALLLRQMHLQREIIKLTISGVDESKDVLHNISELQEKLRKLTEISLKDDFRSLDEVMVDLYNHMDSLQDKSLVGIPTGFKKLDKTYSGLTPKGMFVVAARPSVGKSAFLGKMAIAAATQGHKVAIISLEMDDKQITARLASLTSEIEFWRIYRNRMQDQEQREFFYEKMMSLSNLPIRISDSASVNINDIKAKIAKLKQRNQVDVLFIDYLGLIDTEGVNRNYNREQEVSKISRGLKLIAMQNEIPVVVLCQLNRMSEQTGDKKPKLHHLRESGSIEQDADGVIFLHRDWMSGIKERNGKTTEKEADIIVAKWRNGEVGEYKIGFDGDRMRFYELDEDRQTNTITNVF